MTASDTRANRPKAKKDDPVPAGLPHVLRPWADAFAGMPEDHLLLVGHLMAAIAPLVDSQETALASGLDELDSFDDIAASGPLDRLMTSELMWLKLMRGEFARRVAEGEALRRRPVYRDPADDRAVVVLLDNGPRMLGRRRLVALAALLTLGAATLRRGDRFLWTATSLAGPAWQEGLTKRSLSRYINQTGGEDLDQRTLAALLNDAPVKAKDRNAIVWTIAPKHTDFGDWLPRYRLQVDELWPDPTPSGGHAATGYGADVSVISAHGVRRTARFAFPDEQMCADTLKAPFKNPAPQAAAGSGWAPDWMFREADEGGAVIRHGNGGIVLQRRHLLPLRVDLDENHALLGARWPGNGPGALVLRQGDEIHAIRFDKDGRVFKRGSTTLAADHPLIAHAHAATAVPPLLRLARKSGFTVAAPNGRFYSVSILSEASHRTLSIALLDHARDLRMLARSRSWLLCELDQGDRRGIVLVDSRTGRRVHLRRDPALDKTRRISRCEVIGDTGGIIVRVDRRWRWIAPVWWPQAEETRQPQLPGDAFLLRVDPGQHAPSTLRTVHDKALAVSERRWSAMFWSKAHGLQEWTFKADGWRRHPLRSPAIDGRVTAMVTLGNDILARVAKENGSLDLLEFRPGTVTPKVQSGPDWWESAKCVDI